MSSSLGFVARVQTDSLRGVAVAIDRGLRLKHRAVRNAGNAVSIDVLNARARAEAAAALAVAATSRDELSLLGA
jgi:hypothetical protein